MADSLSKYASRKSPAEVRVILRTAAQAKLPFVKVDIEAIAAIARLFDPTLALVLEIQRLAGLRRVQRHDGWLALTQELLERVALTDGDRRYRAVRRLVRLGVLEIRRLNTYGNKVEYRVNPNWTKPKAEVIDPGAFRTKGKKSNGRS
jgi:hypothetical protein